ncbi:MAG: 3-hydroxybutyryl-CoA dehydrogenase [Alphaproteobacteria bacterium MarineAlpha1_Bin1]|nr:MAG: 3-hydroxybutyryl-CoA dehydrogenase [Alphaproteobacteria bacterium MarineAlpha1_Bin1]
MIQTIGIIGAGQMGNGIAHVLAVAGYDILLTDTSNAQMQKALKAIGNNLSRQVSRGHLEQVEATDALARIQTVAGLPELAHAELVVEAATEDEDIKREILSDLGEVLNSDALICTNTSSISITRLASVSGRPEKFMGMHFMNPVPVMELVELIRGIATDEETFNKVREVVLKAGKVPTNSEDFPAFIVNRILMPMVNEAVYTLYEGVGTVEGIDSSMRLGANHRMGPLELADFIGLDTCLSIMQVLYEGLADSKYRPCPLLVKYVEAGWIGRKAERGFYDYRGEKPVPTR